VVVEHSVDVDEEHLVLVEVTYVSQEVEQNVEDVVEHSVDVEDEHCVLVEVI